jgi:hypothetical protein
MIVTIHTSDAIIYVIICMVTMVKLSTMVISSHHFHDFVRFGDCNQFNVDELVRYQSEPVV